MKGKLRIVEANNSKSIMNVLGRNGIVSWIMDSRNMVINKVAVCLCVCLWHYSSNIPTRTRRRLAPLKFYCIVGMGPFYDV